MNKFQIFIFFNYSAYSYLLTGWFSLYSFLQSFGLLTCCKKYGNFTPWWIHIQSYSNILLKEKHQIITILRLLLSVSVVVSVSMKYQAKRFKGLMKRNESARNLWNNWCTWTNGCCCCCCCCCCHNVPAVTSLYDKDFSFSSSQK